MNKASNLEAIEFLDLTIKPNYYREGVEDQQFVVELRANFSEEEHEKLRQQYKARGYFPVLRRGIEEGSVSMKLGKPEWSSNVGVYKHSIYLVEEKNDENYERGRLKYDYRDVNQKNLLLKSSAMLDLLIEYLVEKQIMSKAELKALESRLFDRQFELDFELSRVKDLDEIYT